MFILPSEQKIFNEYINNGYIIAKVSDINKINEIRDFFINSIKKKFPKIKNQDSNFILNNFHKYISIKKLNEFRLHIINAVNSIKDFRGIYYSLAKEYINCIVGNELAMQQRINLSIQLPNDKSSLLPIHSDTWSGDSPFETVVWMPLVDCYKTKSMYILPPKKMNFINKVFKKNLDTEILFKKIKKDVVWLKVNYGEFLIFNQNLPHGNVINIESETRWSFNCRFKSIFSPYGDKKLGEFFEPISLRPASKIGMYYKYPKV